MTADRAAAPETLRWLIKTDPDPRVRQRAQAVLLTRAWAQPRQCGHLMAMAPYRVRIGQRRYAAEGRAGLEDRSWRGCPPALDEAERF